MSCSNNIKPLPSLADVCCKYTFPPKDIGVTYDKKNIPKGAKYLFKRIEKNGRVNLNPDAPRVLEVGERWIYFFEFGESLVPA